MVGIIHTPRTFFAIGKGLVRRRNAPEGTSRLGGIGENNPFITYCRAGLFDCDYQLHMNNAAYLSHAEYARWEMCAYNGLMHSMYHDNVHFVVGGTVVRFRREIRPVFRKFEVHSFVAQLDDRNMWILHNFRYPPGGKDPGRIRAQVICQGLAVQNRNVIDPRIYLKETVGIDANAIDELSSNSQESSSGDSDNNNIVASLMNKYAEMEVIFKEVATKDDEEVAKKK